DGTVYEWGADSNGQLGNNSTTSSSVPVAVSVTGTPMAGKTVTAIAAGDLHTVALGSDGAVYAWGQNGNGELGNNSTTGSLVPVAVSVTGTPMAGKTVVQITAALRQTFAVASDGTAYSWGENTVGQLGNNTTTFSPVPVAVSTGSPSAVPSGAAFIVLNAV